MSTLNHRALNFIVIYDDFPKKIKETIFSLCSSEMKRFSAIKCFQDHVSSDQHSHSIIIACTIPDAAATTADDAMQCI